MYHTGEVNTKSFEIMLGVVRVAILFVWMFVFIGVGLLLGLIPPLAGLLGGIAGVCLFLTYPILEVNAVSCPSCKTRVTTMKRIGSYRCSNCGKEIYIDGEQVKERGTELSA